MAGANEVPQAKGHISLTFWHTSIILVNNLGWGGEAASLIPCPQQD